MSEVPETLLTRAGDVDIAYQVVRPAGGLDLVFVPGWVSHLEVMWSCRGSPGSLIAWRLWVG